MLHVGTNDISQDNISVDDIISNFTNLIAAIRRISRTKIIISAILPRPIDVFFTEQKIKDVNKRLKVLCDQKKVKFVASFHPFLKRAKPLRELYEVYDGGLHLNWEGTRKLRSVFANTVAHLPLVLEKWK